MTIVSPERIPRVGVAFVDEDHQEEGRLLNALAESVAEHGAARCPAATVLARWDALYAHTVRHFAREEEAMQRTGFPAFPVHRGEHERVLAELREEGEQFRATGDADRLWRYVSAEMPAWFLGHIETMDQVTARFVVARGGGGDGGAS